MNGSTGTTMKLATRLPALALGAFLTLVPAFAAPTPAANPGVLPTTSKIFGKSYGDWVVSYWQWAMNIPAATNPWFNDSTGAFAGIGQAGPVWFLGGTLGDSVTRDVSIPLGKAVFLPVHQWIFGAMAFNCEPSVPGVTCDVSSLRASAAAAALAVDSMDVTIDGTTVANFQNYRTLSPSDFPVTVPDDNLVTFLGGPAVPAGTYGPQVADGYYLILRPPSAGQHTSFLHVVSTLGFDYTITYNLTIS
jgi:hypothetical protein